MFKPKLVTNKALARFSGKYTAGTYYKIVKPGVSVIFGNHKLFTIVQLVRCYKANI